jgi:hypothetical protein
VFLIYHSMIYGGILETGQCRAGAYLAAACLWLVYGLHKHAKTIYLACIGWIALDAAIVAGVIVHA